MRRQSRASRWETKEHSDCFGFPRASGRRPREAPLTRRDTMNLNAQTQNTPWSADRPTRARDARGKQRLRRCAFYSGGGGRAVFCARSAERSEAARRGPGAERMRGSDGAKRRSGPRGGRRAPRRGSGGAQQRADWRGGGADEPRERCAAGAASRRAGCAGAGACRAAPATRRSDRAQRPSADAATRKGPRHRV